MNSTNRDDMAAEETKATKMAKDDSVKTDLSAASLELSNGETQTKPRAHQIVESAKTLLKNWNDKMIERTKTEHQLRKESLHLDKEMQLADSDWKAKAAALVEEGKANATSELRQEVTQSKDLGQSSQLLR